MLRLLLTLQSITGSLKSSKSKTSKDWLQLSGLTEQPLEDTCYNKYSVIIRIKSQSTKDAYRIIDSLDFKKGTFCLEIFVLHNFSSNVFNFNLDFANVYGINTAKWNIHTDYYLPKNISTKYVFIIDDDVLIKTGINKLNLDEIFKELLFNGNYNDKIFSPFIRKVENNMYNIHVLEDFNMLLPNFMLTTTDTLVTYNMFTKVANQELVEYLNNGCSDIWFNFAISKFNKKPFVKLEIPNFKFSLSDSTEVDDLAHRMECFRRINTTYPDIKLPASYDVLYIEN